MPGLPVWRTKGGDIPGLVATRDIAGLIRLMGHKDGSVRLQATDALVSLGSLPFEALIAALESLDSTIRMGAATALGSLRDPTALPLLIGRARQDKSVPVRMAALLALGEIGSAAGVPCACDLLKDPNRHVRYCAAVTLTKLGWDPPDRDELAYYSIALQDWGKVRSLGEPAAGPLRRMLKDTDPSTRIRLIDLLCQTGSPEAAGGCALALEDSRDSVRYMGLISSIRCGLSEESLPLLLARRERTGPNPAAAALLNFLFLGIGYNYIGKWWGFLVFMSYMTIIVLAQLRMGPFLPYLIAYPVTAIFAVQTFFEAKRIADSSGVGS